MANQSCPKRDVEALLKVLYSTINLDDYLTLNPDVSSAAMHPIHHFMKYGWRENRRVSSAASSADLLAVSPSIADGVRSVDNPECLAYLDEIFDRGRPTWSENDVRFVGYVEAKLGLGIAARNTIACYSLFSENFSIYPYNHGVQNRYDSKYLPDKYDTHRCHKINIFELGLDNIDHAWAQVINNQAHNTYNVLKLYWELSEIPTEKISSLNLYDEIWVPSQFVHDAVVKVFDKNVLVIPPFVDTHCDHVLQRDHFDMKKDVFYFLFSFDYNSSIYRKNPMAVVKAFQAAFPMSDRSVGLIIKSNDPKNSSVDPNLVEVLKNVDDRMIFIQDYLDRQTMLSLISFCDCYVSLHRSEGYGMGMAEAICLGRKVLATNYSGNVDFMNRRNSFPVDYKIIDLEADHYYLARGKTWADPLHESAVQQFRAASRSKGDVLRKMLGNRFLYRNAIPGKARLSRMISARISAIKRENGLDQAST